MLGQEYGGHYQYEDLFDGRTHTIICKHGRGEKWSFLYAEAFKHAFNDLLGRDVKIESTEDQVTVRVAIAMEPFRSNSRPQRRNRSGMLQLGHRYHRDSLKAHSLARASLSTGFEFESL
jgi:hypothetical protein